MLFFPAFSPWFYVLYLICGFTDMIDGTIARKTNAVSEFGSRLDTVADFIFCGSLLIKLLPVLDMPVWLWIWTAAIAAIKIANIASEFIAHRKIAAEHTSQIRSWDYCCSCYRLRYHLWS
jgi:CDP-diacylglycerol--glycerol-3-phosphate 3-phosphatidyltransferase